MHDEYTKMRIMLSDAMAVLAPFAYVARATKKQAKQTEQLYALGEKQFFNAMKMHDEILNYFATS